MKLELVIGIAGPPGSGKTSIAKEVGSRLRAEVVGFGDFFRVLADGKDLQEFGLRYVNSRASERVVDEFLAFCRLTPNRPLVVEGIRHVAIWRALAARAKTARLAFLNVERSILEERLAKRVGRIELRPKERLEHPVEAETPKLYTVADVIVEFDDPLKAARLIVERVQESVFQV